MKPRRLRLQGTEVVRVAEFKYLGVTLQSNGTIPQKSEREYKQDGMDGGR